MENPNKFIWLELSTEVDRVESISLLYWATLNHSSIPPLILRWKFQFVLEYFQNLGIGECAFVNKSTGWFSVLQNSCLIFHDSWLIFHAANKSPIQCYLSLICLGFLLMIEFFWHSLRRLTITIYLLGKLSIPTNNKRFLHRVISAKNKE